ncbi:CpsB/CapC family capsule biosynthesis tyrosine phosphatase [Virgibacillus sp. 179-BFC.A HS]|uniref:protein-tyrosine-phosphatase n=1 Tax=Tigheibacillus jepli TaxID=3035914 RepID=A0ABU5CED3_9BACI|nr:CpsB/CapC family capsule biosynthesis tyrosine phosphatase [Virgibacillus sp. 179-BFC.A HS]MDY0404703.1 CpsB/CapC family capsule biosynthesis tyrosine phosphatase [Virgibacillus sp. 179-BFC.A HS]
MVGRFGKAIQKFTKQIVDANLTHFVASDAHNMTTRGFCMQEAYHAIQELYGYEMHTTLEENAQLLVAGKNVNKFEPERIKKKKFLGFL